LRNEIRRILKSKVVLELQKTQFKCITKIKVYPTKITKQALKLPKAVMELDVKSLTKLLTRISNVVLNATADATIERPSKNVLNRNP